VFGSSKQNTQHTKHRKFYKILQRNGTPLENEQIFEVRNSIGGCVSHIQPSKVLLMYINLTITVTLPFGTDTSFLLSYSNSHSAINKACKLTLSVVFQ